MPGVAAGTSRPGPAGPALRRRLRLAIAVCALLAGPFWLSPTTLLAQQGFFPPEYSGAATPVGEASSSLDSPPPDQPLADIQIEGNVTIPPEVIARRVKAQIGRPVTATQVREDVRALYGTRWFFSVEPIFRQTPAGLVLVFKVVERPMVQKIEYRGNKKIKTEHLAALTGLKSGSPFDPGANREAARRIESEYRDRGYPFAKVELLKGGGKDDREVIFQIEEGPKTKVTSISFTGNEFFSGPLLKTKLRTKTAFLWMFGGKYDPATIPDDIAALKQYYHDLGFFDVQIDREVRFSKDRSSVHIEYKITEGQRYKVRSIQVAGNRIYSEDELRKDFTLLAGEFFNARELNQDVAAMKDKYGKLGRIFASVKAVPKFSEDPGIVDLVYQIDEDRVYYIRRVNVILQGDNPHTKETVVHNRLPFRSGDPADPAKLRLGERRLSGNIFEGGANGPRITTRMVPDEELQYVEHVVRGQSTEPDEFAAPPLPPVYQPARLESLFGPYDPVVRGQNFDGPLPRPGNLLYGNNPQGDPLGDSIRDLPPGYLDVDVMATEARTGRLMFGVGVNSDAGVVGSIVLDESNFDILRPPTSFQDFIDGTAWRGGGQRFRLEAVPGNIVSRYLVSWTDPYFLDTDYSLGLSGFFYNRFLPDWDEQRFGGRITLGRQITQQLSISGALRLEEVQIDNPDVPTPPLLVKALGSSFLSTARVAIAHDTRDSAFLPSEGHYLEASYEQAFGDFDYPQFGLEGRQFFTVYSRPDGTGRHILKLGGQLGWTGDGTPIFERFYAGGFQTFRGFEFRGVSPRQFDVRIGGRYLTLATIEYQLPLTADDNIGMVFFSDAGTVDNNATFDDFRVTAGVGLRLTVPAMGPVPLAFDFAVPIVRQDFDDTQVFSFYIGINR